MLKGYIIKMKNKIALIDMDYTVCDYADSMIPALQKLESPEEKDKYDYTNIWELEKKYPHIANRFHSIHSKQGFWLNLKPIEPGLELYKKLSTKFKTYIVTKALKWCSLAWREKVDWIHKWIGNDVEIMVVTDKRQVMGDLLFDDQSDNAINWLVNNPNGRVLIPKRPHNKQFELENTDPRIVFWDDNETISKTDAAGDSEKVIDFSIPNKLIEEVLNPPNKYEG